MRIHIPECDGVNLNPNGFIDWLLTFKEVFEFTVVSKTKKYH